MRLSDNWYLPLVLRCVLIAVGSAAVSTAMFAQSERLCGAVQDPTGAIIAGASLDLSTAGSRFDTTTDSGGQFCFSALLPGEYELTVQGNGFRNTRRNILVRPGESSRLTSLWHWKPRRNRSPWSKEQLTSARSTLHRRRSALASSTICRVKV